MKKIFILFVFIFILGCSKSLKPLPPNYFFEGSCINIHSPNQEGWFLISKDQTQITFGKYGKKNNESYIARVVFFPLNKTQKDKNFLTTIKKQILDNSNKKRFEVIKSTFRLVKSRKYPCVLVDTLAKDKMAKTKNKKKEELLIRIKSLYCKDPKRKNIEAGFMIGYSYRGEKIISTFDMEADSFIKGVEFPEYE
jgi:hypothetical protein